MNYLALDIETANADYSSICQLGFAEFHQGEIINTWKSLINPQDYFDAFNISIHGIKESDVKNAPTFKEISNEVFERLQNSTIIHHMPFDRIAFTRACNKYNLAQPKSDWVDSARIARRTWEEFSHEGFALQNIANHLQITFHHHDALQDAIAAGKIVWEASKKSGLSIEELLERSALPLHIYKDGATKIKLDGNPEGPLFREQIVFTGSLSITRNQAGRMAAELGCNVTNSVTKKTTILVVGIQEDYKLAGYSKSSKHRKAEELISQGHHLKILSEKDFSEILNSF